MNEHVPVAYATCSIQFYIFDHYIMLTTVNLVELMNQIPPDKICP
jgi:hypothetical protein